MRVLGRKQGKNGEFVIRLSTRWPYLKVKKAPKPSIQAYLVNMDALRAVEKPSPFIKVDDLTTREYLYYYYGYNTLPLDPTAAIKITGV